MGRTGGELEFAPARGLTQVSQSMHAMVGPDSQSGLQGVYSHSPGSGGLSREKRVMQGRLSRVRVRLANRLIIRSAARSMMEGLAP